MSKDLLILAIIIFSTVFMFLVRYLPFLVLNNKGTSDEFDRFIKYIPQGVFVALIVKDIFFKDGRLFISPENYKLIPLFLVILVSVKFKNIGLSVVLGGIIMFITLNLI